MNALTSEVARNHRVSRKLCRRLPRGPKRLPQQLADGERLQWLHGGAIVVVHSSAGDYVRAVLDKRRTLEPDRLETARRDGRQSEPPVMLVDDAMTLTDGTREVNLYQVPNDHSSGMLVGYVPDARVLVTADLVSDTFPQIPPFASRVQKLIQENGLSVEMIACAHGNAMPYAQFAYVLGK